MAGAAVTTLFLIGGIGVARAVSPPVPAAAGSSLEQRLAQRKTETGTVLTDIDRVRLVETCTAAQAKLRLIQNDALARLDKHTKAYNKIDARLWITIGQLKLAGEDTFQLEKLHLTLVDKSANFLQLSTNYEQALDDALVINCKADPTGFKSLLDTSRAYYDLLRKQSVDIHSYVVDSIKPDLAKHVSDLETKAATKENTN